MSEANEIEAERIRSFLGPILMRDALDRVMDLPVPLFGGLTPNEMAAQGRSEEAIAMYRMVFSYQVPPVAVAVLPPEEQG
ncbi:MAG: hypothetical protein M0027_16415 [Candidatus Dormibacteraeota bacterium]|jgi:hypothetical protein|nr:hypothetical protein [Candidatus Dormibacteraeota bacterium]